MSRRFTWVLAAAALIAAMGGTWMTSATANAAPAAQLAAQANSGPTEAAPAPRKMKRTVAGKLNLNTATEDELMLLPSVGPAKAERIVTWRRKNGGFKRAADLRRVKGFGYKTFKRLEPLLDVRGDTTLAPAIARDR
ncbi:MAG: helix-hairpin-helix domain-containing protein [Deltaproteobacteria bacterium]|nr:helix-hairpin-helix domain-containing protein [Deltaproteobacteria bacterium]